MLEDNLPGWEQHSGARMPSDVVRSAHQDVMPSMLLSVEIYSGAANTVPLLDAVGRSACSRRLISACLSGPRFPCAHQAVPGFSVLPRIIDPWLLSSSPKPLWFASRAEF